MIAMRHEGKRLRELLHAAGKSAKQLQEACGNITRPAVDRYFRAETINPRAWKTLRPGLVRLGIRPGDVKVDDVDMAGARDLRPLVESFDRPALEAVREILEAADGDRDRLLYWLDGRLGTTH